MLPGRTVFCKLRGLAFVIKRSILLFESFLLIGAGIEGLDGGMLEVVGELERLEVDKVMGRFFLLSNPPEDAVSGGSSIGVNGEMSGGKMVRLFLRFNDIVSSSHTNSWYWALCGWDM